MRDKTESIIACGVVLLILGMMFGLAKCTLDKHKTEPNWRWKEICKDNDKRAEFIINCAKAANPMSDEEGEDLVIQCERTSRHLFCDEIKEYY